MTVKLGINGFGRIGRQVFRIVHDRPEVEVVAINDLRNAETYAHLLKYDSSYGIFKADVEAVEGNLVVDGKEVIMSTERDPAAINWKDKGVDIVIDVTGVFTNGNLAGKHIVAGAKKVIIGAPGKNVDCTVVLGVNEGDYDPQNHHVVSMASCTTNCLAPLAHVLDQAFGIVRGLMTTVHAYTTDQNILDSAHKDLRRARTAGLSIIPTTTGAAVAVAEVLPQLKGKLSGMAMRVPTSSVSVVDLTVELKQEVTIEDVNKAFIAASLGPLAGILATSDEPLVSIDYKGNGYSSIVDLLLTDVMQGNMVKVLSWYDNEWGYALRVVDLAQYIAKQGF